MRFIIPSFGIAFLITFLAIPVIIRVALEKKLVDVPDARKVHKTPIPSLGGIGIYAGFLVAMLLTWPNHLADLIYLQYITAACCVVFFLGMKDDIMDIGPLKKFIGQLIAAWIIIYKCRLQITNFHGAFGIYELPGFVSVALTYVIVILIINSFNLIDGVDGLSGTLGFLSALSFGLIFYFSGPVNFGYAVLAAALAGAIAAFLIFNHHPAKIFMGDTGSLLVGLLNAVMMLKFINIAGASSIASDTVSFLLPNAPLVAVAILIVPLFDTLRVFSIRILHGRSPFSPDRNHIHHILLDKGFSHSHVTGLLALSALVVMGIACATTSLNINLALGIITVSVFALFASAYYYPSRKQKGRKAAADKRKGGNKRTPIISIVRDAVM
ncbi:MAG: undecaprenyl/decaprenyl-phosphate alpha-N-acetylglucosaminyl 1-phosphate transferase [Dinghuibacter sp.]|nr:undecaprenyl/decaprenyl-phosphate alpha-N-acetylglucosaminyl 1-phosphate transferase [Dinghuibacter sp.]